MAVFRNSFLGDIWLFLGMVFSPKLQNLVFSTKSEAKNRPETP